VRYFKEEFSVSKAVKEVIETNWSSDSDKGKFVTLIKGLVFSEDPKAKQFVKDLDDLTSKMDESKYV
jgi:hypothetical protein